MLFDLMEGGDLCDLLNSNSVAVTLNKPNPILQFFRTIFRLPKPREKKILKGFDESIVRFYVAQVVLAIEYLHE